ncbi:serine/threonine-protein kinase [Nocardia sp. NBC_00511]|uniref:serine/threonine-protein kinase n=1 Tax=Nocardia sp. NBC_00511 TaxID=2903591 RepID=UPI0030DF95FD
MLEPGEIFAGYVIERELGRGGMGAVYLARHPRLPRWIALKLLNPEYHGDSETHTRFGREADLAARLEHPGIVTVYDRGVEHGRLWIAMQYVDGTEAEAVPDMTPRQAVEIVTATADALDYAHRVGVLHRDVKPANIMLARETREQQAGVLLTDFGIARLQEDTGKLTGSGSVMATLAYASPEQLQSQPVDHRSDQYSLACTLFRLLTGAQLFPATDLGAIVKSHLYDSPPPVSSLRPELPSTFDPVLARALAKDPRQRYGSCAEFAAAARRALEAAPATGESPRATGESAKPPVRRTVHRVVPPPERDRTSARKPRRPGASGSGPITPGAARSSGRLTDVPDLFGPYTGRHLKVAAAEPESRPHARRKVLAGLRTMLVLSACLAAVLGVAVFYLSPSSNSGEPKPPPPEIAEMSTKFAGVVPKSATQSSGYGAASCRPADHDTKDFLPPVAFNGWIAAWDCVYSVDHDVREFTLFAYPSAAVARSAVSRIGLVVRTYDDIIFKEFCGGKQYTNYRFDGPDGPSIAFATAFFDDPDRERFLLYTRGSPATPTGALDWWKSLPLTRS